ncbi:MAG: glycerophosphodiester phosphodiesterase family protein [Erythrobacter sp.]|uniref:glycerophosphodiester phosphodiesterase family protein n=1 Tax=Erythrobacter sp. TaxID=1042 RepID=UPI00329819BA
MGPRPVPDWLTQWEYAHRGLHSSGVPENSLAAARAAIDAGMGIECDIQRSFDDQPMVFHDWELDRLTARAGLVEDRTRADLEMTNLQGNGEPIPSLATFLGAVDGRVPLLIEIKSKPGYDVEWSCISAAQLLKDYSHEFAVMSFDPRVAMWFRHNLPLSVCGLVMREDEMGHTPTKTARREAFAAAQPDFLAYDIAALPGPWVAELRAGGLPILTWTVNSEAKRKTALQNADALIAEGAGLA